MGRRGPSPQPSAVLDSVGLSDPLGQFVAKRKAEPKDDATTRRWIKSEADEKAVAHGCWFSEVHADHIVEFFEEHLQITENWFKGNAGQPFKLMDWQRAEVLMPLFGWLREDGTRRYRQAYIEIPKKNGKTPLCAGIGLYLFGADGEGSAHVYCVASDRKQAGLVFDHAFRMATASDLLKGYMKTRESIKFLGLPSTGSSLEVISHEGFRQEGINSSAILFDELHAQKDRRLWDSLKYSTASRKQPLKIAITTAGFDRESICYEVHEYAEKIIAGDLEDRSFFGFIRAANINDDWTDPEVWKKANPSMGETISIENMEQDCLEAQQNPAAENSFRRYRLNQWTEQDRRAIVMREWAACACEIDAAAMVGKPCYAGLDLGESDDLSSLVLVFPVDEKRVLLPFFWVPGLSLLERERKHGVSYTVWKQRGLIESTNSKTTDYRVIRAKIVELSKIYDIRGIGYDVRDASQLAAELNEDGIKMDLFAQSMMNFASPTKEFLRLIKEGQLIHGGNPVLRWMAANLETETDASGNQRPSKKLRKNKIDGIVASIMGLGELMKNPIAGSIYNDVGLRPEGFLKI